MGRRTVLLIVAALIAAVGSGLVFMYARGADSRAEATQQPVQVLKAVQRIDSGETFSQAQSEGKIQLGTVPRQDLLVGAVNTSAGLADKVATTTIYPNEQIVTDKFGSRRDGGRVAPGRREGQHRHLGEPQSDTGRVAGFVNPGAKVAVFASMTERQRQVKAASSGGGTRLLLPKVTVDRRGRHHHGRQDDHHRGRSARPPSSCPTRCSPCPSARCRRRG